MMNNCVCCEKRFKIEYQNYTKNSDNDLNYFCRDCRTSEIVCDDCGKENWLDYSVINDWWIDQNENRDLCGECREKNYQETTGKSHGKYCQRCSREYNDINNESCEKCSKRYNIGDGDICNDCHVKIH